MITTIPKDVELKYNPRLGWHINVDEAYPLDLIAGWAAKVAFPIMRKRVAQLPPGDLREHMSKALPDLRACKINQVTIKPALDIFKSTQKQTTTLYHY